MNLILNAAQAMEGRGKLTVTTRLAQDGQAVEIEIADTGPGIPPEILTKIFEPFFTTKDEGQGTGLGLSLVYGIVENHGGRIKADSKPDQGATFVIELPVENQNHNQGDDRGKGS
jgi:signal transduction histidine kinase